MCIFVILGFIYFDTICIIMSEYNKYQCMMCGNIYPSKRKNPRCVNGEKKGCNSTKNKLLEKNIFQEETPKIDKNEQIEPKQEEEEEWI